MITAAAAATIFVAGAITGGMVTAAMILVAACFVAKDRDDCR